MERSSAEGADGVVTGSADQASLWRRSGLTIRVVAVVASSEPIAITVQVTTIPEPILMVQTFIEQPAAAI